MGLLKAAAQAIGGSLGDQWKDVIRCENMDNNTLMVRKTTKTGVISKDSAIIVGPGQVAVIYDNGQVLDATAEDGIYTFDKSSSPSFFAGQFGEVFKDMWSRFTYGGGTYKEQAVFFINSKEILDNMFGTPSPIPYQDWGHPVMNARTGGYIPLSVQIKCHGKYTFKISNPALFMQELAGTAETYTKDQITEQMRSEVIAVFQNMLSSLGSEKYKVSAMDLPNQTDEIKDMMDEVVFDQKIRERGISIVSFAVESVTFSDSSQAKIDEYELGGDVYQQKGKIVGAYGQAMQDAANNAAGAATGFMGMGMLNMNTGNMAAGVAGAAMNAEMPTGPAMGTNANPGAVAGATTAPSGNAKKCPKCGAEVTGKFCTECGTKIEEKDEKFCPQCGAKVTGKFCTECGTKIEE